MARAGSRCRPCWRRGAPCRGSTAVSVVPMIQCRPQGMTNSTDFSVLVMKPDSERIRSRGTTRWMPLLAWTLSEPRPPTISWMSSVQTPAALTTTRARTSSSRPVSRSTRADADHPLALAQEARSTLVRVATWAPCDGGGAGDRHHEPRVVDLAVVVADRAVQLLGARSGAIRATCLRKRCRCLGTPMSYFAEHRHRVVQREPGADVGPLPGLVQRVEERHRPDQVRREPGQQQAALLQRLADQPEVEHLEVAQPAVDQLAAAAAGARWPGRAARPARSTGRGSRRRARSPAPTMPPPTTSTSSCPSVGRPAASARSASSRACGAEGAGLGHGAIVSAARAASPGPGTMARVDEIVGVVRRRGRGRAARRPGRGCGPRTCRHAATGVRRPRPAGPGVRASADRHQGRLPGPLRLRRRRRPAGRRASRVEAARREAEEELGVTSPLVRLGEADYARRRHDVPRVPLRDRLGRAGCGSSPRRSRPASG